MFVFLFVIEDKVVVLGVVIVVECRGDVVVGLIHRYCSTVKHCLVVLYIYFTAFKLLMFKSVL